LSKDLIQRELDWWAVFKGGDLAMQKRRVDNLVQIMLQQLAPTPIPEFWRYVTEDTSSNEENIVYISSRSVSPAETRVTEPDIPSTVNSESNRGPSKTTLSPSESTVKRKADAEADEEVARKKARTEDQRLANIAQVEADDREYEKNSAAIEEYYIEDDVTRQSSDSRWLKMVVWHSRRRSWKPRKIREMEKSAVYVQSQPEDQPRSTPVAKLGRKAQMRKSQAAPVVQTAQTTVPAITARKEVSRPPVKHARSPAANNIDADTPCIEKQRLVQRTSPTVIDRPLLAHAPTGR
jgi:hypothetical protein